MAEPILLDALLKRMRGAISEGGPVSGEDRSAASQFLQSVLGEDSDATMSGGRQDPYFYQNEAKDPSASPEQDFALMLSKRQHPEAWKRMDSRVGTFDTKGIGGATNAGFMFFNPNDAMNHGMNGSLDTIRHELSHAAGLDDYRTNGRPSAYDVGNASELLHRDIVLPKRKK